MISNIILGLDRGPERLKAFLRSVMPNVIPRDVTRITDLTMIIRFPTISVVDDSDGTVLSITETHRFTLYFTTRTSESQTVTVYELARDKDSPPFETNTVYGRIPFEALAADRSSPFICGEVIEDKNASVNGLDNALVELFIERARKEIADKAESE